MEGGGRNAKVLPLGIGLLGGQWLGNLQGFWAFVLCFSLWVLSRWGRLRVGRGGGLLLLGAWVGALLPLPQGASGGGDGIRGRLGGAGVAGGGPVRFAGRLVTDPVWGAHGVLRARLRVGGEVFALLLLQPGSGARAWARGTRLRGRGFVEPSSGDRRVLRSTGALVRAESEEGATSKLRRHLLLYLQQTFDRRLSPPAAGLCQRLFLGTSGSRGGDLLGLHRRLGISHFLAISGLHTILLAGILAWFLRPLGARAGPLLTGLLLFYAWMTGLRPPVLRAVLAFLFYRWCRRSGKPFLLDSAFALSAIATLALAPQEGAGIGFVLSYLAVAGLAWITPLLGRILQRGQVSLPGSMRAKIRSLLLASAAAWIATLPVSLLVFHRASPWGLLLSPLLVPLVFLLLLGCLLSLLAPLLPPPLPVWVFGTLQGVADLYLQLLGHLDQVGLPRLLTSPALPGAGLWILFAAGLGLAAWRASPKLFLGSCVLTSLLALFPWGRAGGTAITLLPVGDGQCVVVQSRGRVLVLDCGDREGGHRAARALWGFLQEEGLPRIDLLVLSHGDSDHSGGLEEALETLPIGLVLLPSHPKCAPILRTLSRRHQAHRLLLPGETWNWEGILKANLPLESADLQSSNDGGLLSWIQFEGDLRFLCLGDQEGEALDRIRKGLIQENTKTTETKKDKLVLLLPHHGAPSEGLFRLAHALRPQAILESSGKKRALRQSKFHQTLGQKIWTTGLEGRIHLEKRGSVWVLTQERQRGFFFSSNPTDHPRTNPNPPKK